VIFNDGGVVGFGQVVGHGGFSASPQGLRGTDFWKRVFARGPPLTLADGRAGSIFTERWKMARFDCGILHVGDGRFCGA
jgi:hypothetical protein